MSLEEGCMLFQPPLLHTDLIWDKISDTKLLMAWNREMIVLAFRGTASVSNVFADLQVIPYAINFPVYRDSQPNRGLCLIA